MKALQWLKARLSERSTWAGVVVAASGGAMLPEPLNWIAVTAGTIAAILPEKQKPEGVE